MRSQSFPGGHRPSETVIGIHPSVAIIVPVADEVVGGVIFVSEAVTGIIDVRNGLTVRIGNPGEVVAAVIAICNWLIFRIGNGGDPGPIVLNGDVFPKLFVTWVRRPDV